MRIATVIVPVLLGLAAMPALAQHAAPSGSGQSEMSYKDYLAQRARLLLRMKGENPRQQRPVPDAAHQEGRYGQGYASRARAQDSAAHPPQDRRAHRGRSGAGRAEHPRVERPERPHFERPERPGRP